MGGTEIVEQWAAHLKSDLLPTLARPLVKALADFSLALAEVGACRSGRVAAATRGNAMPASRRRRRERWLANDHFQPAAVQRALAHAVWQRWAGPQALLLLDETSRGATLRRLQVSLAYRGRAIPLAAVCYRPHHPPGGMPRLVRRLLDQAAAGAPAGTPLVVIADRGLAWPALVDHCTKRGWHFLLRLQGQTRARLPDGRRVAARDLAPRPGSAPWVGRAEVFRKAGGRAVALVALWARGCKEPWLLITDQSGCVGRWRQYARRMWIEEAFRDDKSQGFGGHESRVDDPAHASRLVTVLALAMALLLSLGTWLIKRGLGHEVDPRRARRLSLFQLGRTAVSTVLNGLRPNWLLQLYFCAS